jgi:hypothetical protein
MRWATRLLLATVFLPVLGCRTAPSPAAGDGSARIRELEARIEALEARAKAATADDEVLALEVEREALLVTYTPEHPRVLAVERRIQALEKMRTLESRQRREAMLRRFEVERESLLVMYTTEHDAVRRLDAQIAFLKADAG